MNKIFFLFFIILNFSSFSQSIINSPTTRDAEFLIYSDSLAHTNFYPSKINFNVDTSKTLNFSAFPICFFTQSYDATSKNFANNYLFGAGFNVDVSNKISLNISAYYGFFKTESFLNDFIDSLSVIPSIGTINWKNENKYRYSGIIGNFIYQPQNFIFFEIGNKKSFLGDGYRSLFLSDNSSSYPYFKANVEVGSFKYLYMIAKQKDFDFRYNNDYIDLYPKYTFTHYLSINFLKRFNFSLFETVVSSPYDSLGARRGIDLNYLNPVIFFRSVETQLGSPDNVLVGFSGHAKIFKSGMLYGQVFIDEFILSHIKSSTEYWDEKYGFQAGAKFFNSFGVKRFYTQLELNAVRPYTYSHNNPIRAYTNNLQPLAHPLGANFVEGIAIASYTFGDYFSQIKLVYSRFGENDSLNYGKDPLLSYGTRVSDDGIKWLLGNRSSLKFFQFTFGMQKNFYLLSFDIIYRNLQINSDFSNSFLFQISFGKPLFNRYFDWQ